LSIVRSKKVPVRQVHEVAGADELHPDQLDEIYGEKCGDRSEGEGADDPISQSLTLLMLRQPQDEHSQNHGVVCAQQPFKSHQQDDGQEVGRLDHRRGDSVSMTQAHIDTARINAYTWISARCAGRSSLPIERAVGKSIPRNGRSVLHQRGGADARNASPDSSEVRAAWPCSPDTNDRKHASVLTWRARSFEGHQAPGRRCRY